MILRLKGKVNPLCNFLFRWFYLPLMTQDYPGEYEKNLIFYYKDRLTQKSKTYAFNTGGEDD